jgi:hypothetical protein
MGNDITSLTHYATTPSEHSFPQTLSPPWRYSGNDSGNQTRSQPPTPSKTAFSPPRRNRSLQPTVPWRRVPHGSLHRCIFAPTPAILHCMQCVQCMQCMQCVQCMQCMHCTATMQRQDPSMSPDSPALSPEAASVAPAEASPQRSLTVADLMGRVVAPVLGPVGVNTEVPSSTLGNAGRSGWLRHWRYVQFLYPENSGTSPTSVQ